MFMDESFQLANVVFRVKAQHYLVFEGLPKYLSACANKVLLQSNQFK